MVLHAPRRLRTPPRRAQSLMTSAKQQSHSHDWVRSAVSLGEDGPTGELRGDCVSALEGAGLPTTNEEQWRFCDIAPLSELPPRAPLANQTAPSGTHLKGFDRVVSIDGNGVTHSDGTRTNRAVTPMRGNIFALLNGAAYSHVHTVDASEAERVHIVHVGADAYSPGQIGRPLRSPRVHVRVPAGFSVTVIEEFVGGSGGLTNSVTEVSLARGASCEHMVLQAQDIPPEDEKNPESADAAHFVRSTLVDQDEGSTYALGELAIGSAIARHDLDVVSHGNQTHTDVKTFNLASAHQLQDLHSRIAIDYPSCTADQLHKSIATSNSSHSVFDGNINVSRSGQQTDAGQLSRNLLMAPRARVNARPNLQINADDVSCTHGCTVSDLGELELFYFRTRGVGEELARIALVEAFGMDVVSKMPCGEEARKHATSILRRKLASSVGASFGTEEVSQAGAA